MKLSCAGFWVTLVACEGPKLVALHTSHGPSVLIKPNQYTYAVSLPEPIPAVALVPKFNGSIDSTVRISWGDTNDEKSTSLLGVQKQIVLPADGTDITVKIDLDNGNPYYVTFQQTSPPPTGINGFDVVDNMGGVAIIEPTLNEDIQNYDIQVNPLATSIQLNAECRGADSQMLVDETKYNYKSKVKISRELYHHTQVIEVTCRRQVIGGPNLDRKYVLNVRSDYTPHELDYNVCDLSIVGQNKKCVFRDLAYYCPDPNLPNHRVQFNVKNNPTIKYTLFNRRRSTEVRLINGHTTIPFTYSGHLVMRHEGARYYRDYHIIFDGSAVRSILNSLGTTVVGLLILLTILTVVVLGAASIHTLGFPLGATEIVGLMAFLIQYLCFSQTLKGSPKLTEFIEPLAWVTLFAPLPFQFTDCSFSTIHFSFDKSRLGDVKDVRNAGGAIFWSLSIFCVFLAVHGCVLARFYWCERKFTLPHHVRFGGWENRVIHFLTFPAVTAAAICVSTDELCHQFKWIGYLIIIVSATWILVEFLDVYQMVKSGLVVWVWNASLREDGTLEDESGFWVDSVADQLLTQPVNRTHLRGLFPYSWVSPVADIMPVLSLSTAQQPDTIHPPLDFRFSAHRGSSYGLSKTPHEVQVVRCRKPGVFCRGQTLICGLFRTSWLDVLLTFECLTKFHAEAYKMGACTMKLIVKTSQLSGHLAGGRAMFFFDGVRVPFIRLADAAYRFLIGLALGVALNSSKNLVRAYLFGFIAISSIAILLYTALLRPYTRTYESWLASGTYGVVTISACAMALVYVTGGVSYGEVSQIADLTLWAVVITCLLLGLYSIIVDVSVISAVVCPPLDESRFLEQLANVAVAITNDPDSRNGFRLETPAYSKQPVKDLYIQATQTGSRRIHVSVTRSRHEPCLEFTLSQIKSACTTGNLEMPLVTIVARSRREKLGYKSLTMTKLEQFQHQIIDFLVNDDECDAYPLSVARELQHHIQLQYEHRKPALLTITIDPSK